jgi:hypothetical protein
MKAQSSMRTIVQYEQLSGSYAQSDHVEMLGQALDAVNGGRCAGKQSAEKIPRVKASVHKR